MQGSAISLRTLQARSHNNNCIIVIDKMLTIFDRESYCRLLLKRQIRNNASVSIFVIIIVLLENHGKRKKKILKNIIIIEKKKKNVISRARFYIIYSYEKIIYRYTFVCFYSSLYLTTGFVWFVIARTYHSNSITCAVICLNFLLFFFLTGIQVNYKSNK